MKRRDTSLSMLAVLLLALLLVSCGGQPLDSTPDNEKQGPGLFSGESGMFRLMGKPDPEETGSKTKEEE